MSTLNQIKEGFSQALDNLAEGWYELRKRASHALTRFHPTQKTSKLETAGEQQISQMGSRWGLLAAEVKEDDNELLVKLEAPGMDPENFEIHVVDDFLVVKGEKQVEREEQRGRYFMMERAYGRFERAIPLPSQVNESGAKAQYRRGVLRIALPKSKATRSRRIEVKTG